MTVKSISNNVLEVECTILVPIHYSLWMKLAKYY
ncbi:Uncharacterised protein [Streptococcus pneumoniae]|nr:Uncharacterised protein [Streptococcus pneumoniae]